MAVWRVKIINLVDAARKEDASKLMADGWEPFAGTSLPGKYVYTETEHFIWLRHKSAKKSREVAREQKANTKSS